VFDPGDFFTDRNAIRKIDTFRIVYLATAVVWFFITEAGRFVWRPFVNANNINDFGLADSVGNWGGIVVQIFFMLAVMNSPRRKSYRVIAFVTVGYIAYEFLQPYLPKGVFDWKDVYGTLIGGVISLGLLFVYHKFIKSSSVLYEF